MLVCDACKSEAITLTKYKAGYETTMAKSEVTAELCDCCRNNLHMNVRNIIRSMYRSNDVVKFIEDTDEELEE